MQEILQTKDGFGIHTFMLTKNLNYEEYRELKLILQKNVWEKKELPDSSYIKSKYFMMLGYFGISSRLFMQNGFARLEIIVNPTDLIENKYTQSNVFSDCKNCKTVTKKLDEALSNINMKSHMFILSRIDLCVNFSVTSAILSEYIKLGRKSYLRNNVTEDTFSDDQSDCHSLTLKCPSFEIEIYDKEYEISKRMKKPTNKFGNLLRLEVRMPRDRIHRHCSEWNCYSLSDILHEYIVNEKEIMTDCFKRCFRLGFYMTLETGREVIDSCDYKGKTKKLMYRILESRCNFENEITILQNELNLSYKNIIRLIRKFEKINLNSAVIVCRSASECGNILPGFIDLLNI